MSNKIINIPAFDLLNKKEGEVNWRVEDMAIGDYIIVQVVNKKGDRNLDGTILKGKIKDLVPSHNMVRLESGWCCHTKDKLLKHKKEES